GVGAGGWSPLDTDHYPWLQVDLGNRKQVTAVATQGRYSSSDWTTRYRLLYSDTGRNWKPYNQDGNIWTFTGNSNTESVVRHNLQHTIVARFLNFIPLDWSEEGRIGLRIEIYGCSYWADVINFDGQGVISYRFKMKKMKILKDVISLKFKTAESDGVILHGEGQQGDYITLELKRGRLLLQINLDMRNNLPRLWKVMTSKYKVSKQYIGDIHRKRQRNSLILCAQSCFNGFAQSGVRQSFRLLNYRNYRQFLFFFKLKRENNMVSLSFQFRTWNSNGLLVFSALADGMLELTLKDGKVTTHLSVTQQKNAGVDMMSDSMTGRPKLLIDLFQQRLFWEPLCEFFFPIPVFYISHWFDANKRRQWISYKSKLHSIFVSPEHDSKASMGTDLLQTDWKKKTNNRWPRQLSKPQCFSYQLLFLSYFLSAKKQMVLSPDTVICILISGEFSESLKACGRFVFMSYLSLSSLLSLKVQSCFTSSYSHRCLPNHCEHGGSCTQTWDFFSCSCDGTGYTGATCHTSLYEQSCEAYKHMGKYSDVYWIDPDGSGPLGPFRVFCNMTEDKVWTTVVNSLPAQTAISGSSRDRRSVLQLNYSATMEQIGAVTDSADHCEQHITYTCRSSRLLNTPGGTPYTWWVGRGNEKHFYWGGSVPGVQKCSCGIEHNCIDPKHHCNCDADQKQWREDSGFLMYKDHLPVSEVAVGDTNRPKSEAKLTVGPLHCHGDRSYWNAASFNTPTSYLHFPTFRAEMSADISFYFKTSAPHGVFLENLGNTDFIRLELKSPNVIMFSFDVGNGPVELQVLSPTPLNDDQWHRVSSERNVKEAVLQLDQQYKQVRAAPAQGHARLELYSQLYVGAAGGQKGFLGCIRSLKMNGVTLDLEERAKVTPGVKPGCSGHCTSFGMYCHNRGKCVEKYNGYSCDCSNTAYEGPFCTKDVGAYFEAGTMVWYKLMPEGKDLTQSSPTDVNLTQEVVTFSFSTTSTPSILLYISSRILDYMAVVLQRNGSLQLLYNLGGLPEPFAVDLDQRNLANGQPHSINITRIEREIYVQVRAAISLTHSHHTITFPTIVIHCLIVSVFLAETGPINPLLIEKYNTPGFVGCLSRVQFNNIAPLKAALRPHLTVSVSHQGKLVESNCGASPLTVSPMSANTDPWNLEGGADFPFNEERVISAGLNRNSTIIGGVIAVVIFTILCTLVFLVRYMFRHKGTYHTNESKGAERSESADTAIINAEPHFAEALEENKKEWFI
ncbi:contactin-associated protein-like 2 precursor, partial [Silurus asotus]